MNKKIPAILVRIFALLVGFCSHGGGADGEYPSVKPQTTEHRDDFGFHHQG
jgi:hypothetical protein